MNRCMIFHQGHTCQIACLNFHHQDWFLKILSLCLFKFFKPKIFFKEVVGSKFISYFLIYLNICNSLCQTCYSQLSSERVVKWRNLWWVLVAIGLFLFVCILIALITLCILHDQYKDYMNTHKTCK